MLVGVVGPQPRHELGTVTSRRAFEGLTLGWAGDVEVIETDIGWGALDGFLLPHSPRLDDVVAAGSVEAALDAVASLRGAYLLAAWWPRSRRGLIAGDHFGMRGALVHGEGGPVLRFATGLSAMRGLLDTTPAVNRTTLAAWLAPAHQQGRRTWLEGVERLGPAQALAFGGGRRVQRSRFWQLRYEGTRDEDEESLVRRLRAGLDTAVGRRLDSGRPTGIVLSGGLDSSVVAAVAAARVPAGSLRAYSAVFPEHPLADERDRILATTDALRIPSVRLAPRPRGVVRMALEQLVRDGTVPSAPGGIVERGPLDRAVEDGVSLLLDGQGGDELFGWSPYLVSDRLRGGDLLSVRDLLRRMPVTRTRHRRASVTQLRSMVLDFGLRPGWLAIARRATAPIGPDVEGARMLVPGLRRELEERQAAFPWLRADAPRWWAHLSHALTDGHEQSGLADHLWQRTSAFGLKSTAPLFDVELVEAVLRLPPEAAWRRMDRPLARRAVAGELPDAVRLNRRKANIGPFYVDLVGGVDRTWWQGLLSDRDARLREYLSPGALEAWLDRRPGPRDPDVLVWATVSWRLVTAELLLRWLDDAAIPERLLADPKLPVPASDAA